jgi:titin
VTEVTDDSVTLEWSPPVSNGGAPIIGYPIERKEPGRSQWIRVTRVEPDVTWHTIKNLLEGRGYVFRVFAENAEGLSEPAVIDKAAVPQRPLGKDKNSSR